LIERVDFALEMGRDRVTPQFAVRRQQPALDGQRLLVDVESVDALVMRQLRVDRLQGVLDLPAIDIARFISTSVAAIAPFGRSGPGSSNPSAAPLLGLLSE